MTTPPYYPVGWNKERWQSATDEEFTTLTEEDFEKFHTGIREDLSEDELEEFFDEMDRRRAAARGAASSSLVSSRGPPNFVRVLNQVPKDHDEFSEWGFIVFRTAGYGDDDAVQRIKERIDAEMEEQFAESGDSADIQRAKEQFRLMWMEGNSPSTLCLCVDESSMNSLQQDTGLAHVLAVSVSCGLELIGDEADDERWTGSFKVAVRTLITELFPAIGDDSLTPYEIGVGVTDDLVWTDISRDGRQKFKTQ